jgi:hypothetical protein
MSETIPQRLRRYIPLASYDGAVLANIALFAEAAAEIDRLTEEVARLRRALARLLIHRARAALPQGANMSKKHTLGDAPIQPEYVEQMNQLARFIDQKFNGLAKGKARKAGFVLLVFPFGENDGARCNFSSNGADRADLAVLFKEMAARMAGMPEVKGGRA